MNHHLRCRLCASDVVHSETISELCALYLIHVVQEHWDMVLLMHTRPDLVDEAHQLAKEQDLTQ